MVFHLSDFSETGKDSSRRKMTRKWRTKRVVPTEGGCGVRPVEETPVASGLWY